MRGFVVLGITLVACGGKKDAGKQEPPPPPVRVVFGDCTDPGTAFVSGRRPIDANTPDPRYATIDMPASPAPSGHAGSNVQEVGMIGLTGEPTVPGWSDGEVFGGLLGNEVGEMNGGFGYGGGGFGPGGSGSIGTIGTGRYGKIGHGTGTPNGYGVGAGPGGWRGRTAPVPTTSLGQPAATTSGLDKAIIRRYIKRNIEKLEYCYEKQLLAKPGIGGKLVLGFTIDGNGRVVDASIPGDAFDPEVATCVVDVVKAIEFPKPHGGTTVVVTYPFTFKPADGSAGSAAPRATAPPPADDAGSAHTAADVPAPGATNPLHDQEQALGECFRATKRAHAAIVVDLAYDAVGGVTSAKASGLDDASFAACVATAAKLVKRTEKTATAQRCGVAFGEQPTSELPAIAITADAVTWTGKVVERPRDILADSEDTWKLPALLEALTAWDKLDPKTPVTMHGPGLLEPLDATPMKVVTRALITSYAAKTDFVLAAKREGAWQPLRELALPSAPVAVTAGTSWNGMTFRWSSVDRITGEDHVLLSVYIAKDALWTGVSRVFELKQLPHDWGALEKALKEHKATAFFADRGEIQIAGADDVPYSDVVTAIEIAKRVGFTEWQVVAPRGLATHPDGIR
jgi:hypothetical protein